MDGESEGNTFMETNTEMMKASKDVPRLIEALLYSEDMIARSRAAEVLGELQNGLAIEPLIVALTDPYSNVRESAATALTNFGDEAVDPLLDALRDVNDTKRSYAAGILGRIASERAIEGLVVAMSDQNPDVRYSVVGSLSQIPGAADSLIGALKNENEDVRVVAAVSLGRMHAEQAIDPLVSALKDESEKARDAAAGALVSMGQDAVEPLMHVLSDENWQVRFYATSLLGILGDPAALEPLKERLQDENADVRQAAESAIKKIQES
ncbi:MAG TPA: HEAT repeat domain-containing protein [Methanomicrobiales archaeon]|nr:HEAT repeat domain-containing protein [Methanomicrobiales archaeon]